MRSSAGWFSMRELLEDKWFVTSLVGSIVIAAGGLATIAVVNYQNKIPVRPIADVVRLDDAANDGAVEEKPISEITSIRTSAKSVAWTGWAIPLRDLCQAKGGGFSQGFSKAFENKTAKLVIPAADGPGWTVAKADLSASNCAQLKDNERSQGICAIFDGKIPSIADRQVRAVFVRSTRMRIGTPSPSPSKGDLSPAPLSMSCHRGTVRVFHLAPVPRGPGPVGRCQPLRHDPLEPESAGVLEDRRAVFVGVLVEHDAGGQPAQQPLELRLALAERQGSKILAVQFQQIERVKDRAGRKAPVVERFEHSDADGIGDCSLAVQGERLGAQLGGRRGDCRIAVGPVMAAAREEVYRLAVAAHDQAIAIVFDLVHRSSPEGGVAAKVGMQGAMNPSVRTPAVIARA
jgi:hypothetical protein